MTTTKISRPEMVQNFIEFLTDDEAIKSIENDKGLQPMFLFLCINGDGEQQILPPFHIPDELMKEGRKGKDFFMQNMFPEIKNFVTKVLECEIVCIAFMCEAWRKVAEKDEDIENAPELNEDNSDMEIVMFSFHHEKGEVSFMYPVIRICDQYRLGNKEVIANEYKPNEKQARFSNLYHK